MSMYMPQMAPTVSVQKQAIGSGIQARASTLYNKGSTTARMPTQAQITTGNMSPTLNNAFEPLAPEAPQRPMVTQDEFTKALATEKNRKGMLSTFLGRDPTGRAALRRDITLAGLTQVPGTPNKQIRSTNNNIFGTRQQMRPVLI